MQTQLWAVKNLKYDFIILIDADIEVVDYSFHTFNQELSKLKENNIPWAVGLKPKEDIEKFKKKTTLGPDIDSGMIVVNTAHKSIEEIFTAYEQFWETGSIHELKKAADGEVIFELIKKYPCNFLTTKMLGPGKILYEFGLFHHAGKSNKADYSSKFYPN
jgi:hypothetical protein